MVNKLSKWIVFGLLIATLFLSGCSATMSSYLAPGGEPSDLDPLQDNAYSFNSDGDFD